VISIESRSTPGTSGRAHGKRVHGRDRIAST
jgi:hypothetical protein